MSDVKGEMNKLVSDIIKLLNLNESMEGTSLCKAGIEEKGTNLLLYGVPGSGKSWTIKHNYCDDETRMERTVFHPDYTYSDFVGQILPSVDKENNAISYPFIPGPFTRILKKAHENPDKEYFFVIEEINRGNAPAIFGDLFQLLDRKNGQSEYGINNADIAEEVYGDRKQSVKLPPNLTLLATMNTADQNVFTLDSAFKRRWTFKRITNDMENCDKVNPNVLFGTEVTWKIFAQSINSKIRKQNDGLGSEDKELGAFFVTEKETRDPKLFAEKVIIYLWNDVFKYDRPTIFNDVGANIDGILETFANGNFEGVFKKEIFPANLKLVPGNDYSTTEMDSRVSEQTAAETILSTVK